jgi:HNH endonuclease
VIRIDDVPAGSWELDHVLHVSRGGARSGANCLPACVACNRLRLNRRGAYVRTTLRLGLIARDKIKDGRQTGRDLLTEAKRRWPQSSDWPELGSRRQPTTMRPCGYAGCVGGTRTEAGGVRKHTHPIAPVGAAVNNPPARGLDS